jgi:translation initiation factor 4E
MTEGNALHTPHTFSFMRRGKVASKPAEESAGDAPADGNKEEQQQQQTPNPYESSIKTFSTVETVEEFWATYNFLKRPNDLPSTTDYHFFRSGIKPTWEDQSNAKGGKWIVRFPKGLASRFWEEILLALIGCQFTGVPDGEICGAVLSIRHSEDIIGIWNRTSVDRDIIERIRDALKKILQLPSHAQMEYKPHQTSMQDRTSFRNTRTWKPKSTEGRLASQGESRSTMNRRSGSWGEREERKPNQSESSRAWR